MNISEFGASVKAKYPQYNSVDNETLGKQVLAKYPQYSRVVDQQSAPQSTNKPIESSAGIDYGSNSLLTPEQRAAADAKVNALNQRAAQTPTVQTQQEQKKQFGSPLGLLSGAIKGIVDVPREFAALGSKIGQFASDKLDEARGIKRGPNKLAQTLSQATEQTDFTKPQTGAERLGYGAEKVAEFFVPGGAVAKGAKAAEVAADVGRFGKYGAEAARALGGGRTAAKIAANVAEKAPGLLTRAGLEAGTTAGITATQSGGDVKSTLLNAGIAGAFPIAGAAIGKVAAPLKGYLSEKLAPRLVNSVLKPLEKEFRFGRNPGTGVIEEGITANTRGGLLEAITKKKQDIGKQLDSILNSAVAKTKTVDVSKAIAKLDEFLGSAQASSEPALYQRLQAVKTALTQQMEARSGKLASKVLTPVEKIKLTNRLKTLEQEQARFRQGGAINSAVEKDIADIQAKLSPSYGMKPTQLTPMDAALLKREIGDATKWTGQAFDNEVNQARVAVYRALNDAIDAAVPGTKKLNQRYANMLSAEKSLERTLNIAERQNTVGFQDVVGGGIGAALGVSSGGIPALVSALAAAGILRGVKSAAVNTRLAQVLSELSPEERTMLAKIAPVIKNIITAVNANQNN